MKDKPMELPALKLPAIDLPFDIPTLMHPPVDHFAIAIPVLVLLIEIINLVVKKRAIGVLSFVLLALGAVAIVAAYLTGIHDGKEAFDALSQAGQAELKEHKLFGTYLVVGSVVVLVFKMLAAMIKRGLVKALFLLVLVVFIAALLKQGKDGGELVYEYGANVERVTDLNSELSDAKETLDETKESSKSATEAVTKKVEVAKEAVSEAVDTAAQKGAEVAEDVKESTADAVEAAKEKSVEAVQSVQESTAHAVQAVEEKSTKVVEALKEKVVQEHVAPAASEVAEHAPQVAEHLEAATH